MHHQMQSERGLPRNQLTLPFLSHSSVCERAVRLLDDGGLAPSRFDYSLDAVARSGFSSVPDLDLELTRRERQLLNVLHAAPWPLRSDQLAALVWSDAHRSHEVRSTLYRLRVKLRGTPWSIPIQSSRQGLRLVRRPSGAVAA